MDPFLNYLIRKCCIIQSHHGDEATIVPINFGEQLAKQLDTTEEHFHVEFEPDRAIVFTKRSWYLCCRHRDQLKLESETQRKLDDDFRIAKETAITNVYTKLRAKKHLTDEEISKIISQCLAGLDFDLAKILGLEPFIPQTIKLNKSKDKYEQYKDAFDD